MKEGHATTRAHDYKRNGTACLMAAPAIVTGKVTGRMTGRHRSEEPCLPGPRGGGRRSRRRCPRHPGQRVFAQVREGPRVAGRASGTALRFTAVSASWVNAVEGFFPERPVSA